MRNEETEGSKGRGDGHAGKEGSGGEASGGVGENCGKEDERIWEKKKRQRDFGPKLPEGSLQTCQFWTEVLARDTSIDNDRENNMAAEREGEGDGKEIEREKRKRKDRQ